MSRTKFVLLGTGTPRYTPGRAQQSSAVIVDDQAYLIDCGDGTMVRIAEAASRGLDALTFTRLTHLFLTHLHPDHTCGLPGLLIGPWVMRRRAALHIYGPPGTQTLVDGLLAAYHDGLEAHRNGLAPLNHPLAVEVHEVAAGQIYRDDRVTVTAFPVDHGHLDVYGLKFVTPDKVIVHSADTRPTPSLLEHAQGCDILIHEVYLRQSLLDTFGPEWQRYHATMHTSEIELADIANQTRPKLLILNHQLIWGDHTIEDLLAGLTSRYDGPVVYGRDLDTFS
ncbi:MAG: MBL fold metallo-hydrolase [Anaerolineales bacterium]|nr:MBL fold metallo-hydrolase [Anaerolineales bacterium]